MGSRDSSLRKEMTRLEEGVKMLNKGSQVKPAVGRVAGNSAGGSKSQERGRIRQAVCFKCGGDGHISLQCRTKPQNVSKEDIEKKPWRNITSPQQGTLGWKKRRRRSPRRRKSGLILELFLASLFKEFLRKMNIPRYGSW